MVFAGLIVVGVAVVHWYLWLRLVRSTSDRPRVRRAGAWAVGALGVLFAVTAVGNRALPRRYEPALERVVGWPGYVWLALAGYLILALAVLELPAWLARRVTMSKPAMTEQADRDRRLLVARSVAIVAGLAATGVTAGGMVTALGPPTTRRVRIPLAKLPRGMDGTRIALVSDVHLGALRGRAHTEPVVAAVNALDADIVAMVGDLVDGTVEDLAHAVEPLRGLRGRRGAYFVTGNHEYFSGHEDWIGHIGTLGLRVLRNARVELDGLDLAGVNDATGGTVGDPPDYDLALGGRDPARPVVLLAHPAGPGPRGREAGRGPAAVRAHARRAAVAVPLCDRHVPAGDLRPRRGRRDARVCHERRRVLGAAGAGRRGPGRDAGRTAHRVRRASRGRAGRMA